MKQYSLFESHSENGNDFSDPTHHWTLFVDGASRNNPGPAGAGIYIVKDGEYELKYGYYLGKKTNNQAEYLALILGLLSLKKQSVGINDRVRIVSDSELLIKQINGIYRVKNEELKPLHTMAKILIAQINAHAQHVLRTENQVADAMANVGVDKKVAIPEEYKSALENNGIFV